MKVIINPGHSTTSPGVMGPTGLYEHDAVFALSQVLKAALEERKIEAEILVQPGGNEKWALSHLMQRVNARQHEVDIFLSLHCAFSKDRAAYGTRIHYLEGAEESRLLAENLFKHFPKTPWAGIFPSQEFVLQQARCPAVLIEVEHLSNPEAEMLMRHEAWLQKTAERLVAGLFDFIGPQDIRLIIDGKEIFAEPVPQVVYGDIMVPVRVIADALGAKVEWDGDARILRIFTRRALRPSEPSEEGKEAEG